MASEDELLDQYEHYRNLQNRDCTLDERVLYSQQQKKIAVEFQARFERNILEVLKDRKR